MKRRGLVRQGIAGGAIAALVLSVLIAGSSTAPSTGSATGGGYGPGIGADSLANTQVGGDICGCPNSATSYRFRATTSAPLASVRIYLVDGSGYAGGTGGTLSISVETDDGSALHAPSGRVLASTSIRPGNPIAIGYLPLVTFPSPATLTAGELYHLVFRNTDPAPSINYVSVDSLWTRSATTPRQPGLSDLDWAQLLDTGSGWTLRPTFTPILDLGYASGVHAGMGYMEVWVNAARTISGASAVRELFSPTAARSVASVAVRLRRVGGSSPLTLRLESADGTLLASGLLPAASVGSSPAWASVTLSSPVALTAAQGYRLVLGAPADTTYEAYALERGNNYHFAPATYFADGYAQYTTGAAWTGFDQPGGSTNNTNADLQFLFR